MAGGMQAKLMREMGRVVENASHVKSRDRVRNLEFVDQPSAANTGRVYIQGGLTTYVEIRYDFQATYAGFAFTGSAVRASATATADRRYGAANADALGVRFHHVDYGSAEKISAVLDMLRAILAEGI